MSPSRESDRPGHDPARQAPSAVDGHRPRARQPEETTNLVVSATADSNDADVLRAVLARIDQGRATVHDALTQIGTEFFREEKGWRRLFARLLEAPAESAAFKRRALGDYLEWMEAAADTTAVTEDTPGSSRDRTVPVRDGDSVAHLSRLVRGRPTGVHFDGINRIECRLGKCVLWITPGVPPKLAITGQRSIPLEVGRTRVGRALENEVVLGERWPDVSRHHLLIEVTRARDIVLTDLSSHGTLVTTAGCSGPAQSRR